MTRPLEGSLNFDDEQLREHNTGGKDLTRSLQHELEQEYGPGNLITSYDGYRTIKYKFEPVGGAVKEQPPMNQVDATTLRDPESLASSLYGLSGLDPELIPSIRRATDALKDTPVGDHDADINRLEAFLKIFEEGTKA